MNLEGFLDVFWIETMLLNTSAWKDLEMSTVLYFLAAETLVADREEPIVSSTENLELTHAIFIKHDWLDTYLQWTRFTNL